MAALVVLLALAGCGPLHASDAQAEPTITLSPDDGAPGTQVTVSGQKFPGQSVGQISWAGNSMGMPVVSVSPTGAFRATLTVPNVDNARYLVSATVGNTMAAAAFQVTESPLTEPTPTAGGQTPSARPTVSAAAASPTEATATPESADSIGPQSAVAAESGSRASPSGEAIPAGDIPGWHQVFAEDFTTDVPLGGFPGEPYSRRWNVYPDGWQDTRNVGTYMASRVLSVANGMLDFYVHTENGVHMVAAPLPKVPGTHTWGAQFGPGVSVQGRTYGRYSVRFRADQLHGYKAGWLLWPDSERWPDDGEIDFPESNLDAPICGYPHWASSDGGQDSFCTTSRYGQWHTSTTEWLPNKINMYLDGVLIGTSTHYVPSTPMHWVLQVETSTDYTVPSDDTAGHVQIDWVVAYAPA